MKTTGIGSLESRLTLVLLSALLLPTALIGWFAYGQLAATIKTERIKTVGRVSDARHEQLAMRFHQSIARSRAFLADLQERCGKRPVSTACGLTQWQAFIHAEGALGAMLRYPRGDHFTIGDSAVPAGGIPSFRPGQLAQFTLREAGAERKYFIVATDPATGLQMAVTYSVQKIQSIFGSHPDLGNSGENFLADPEGYFITSARYPSTQGHSHPISAVPMQRCLTPENAETLDLDYRDVPIIHGFRFVPETGGGCIMAHIDQAEAFAPLAPLTTQFLITMLIFSGLAVVAARYWSGRIANPIKQMTDVTRSIAAGNLASRAVSAGYTELAEFATAFNTMTDQLVDAQDTLEQRVLERTASLRESDQRFRQLFNCGGDAIFVAGLLPDGRQGNFVEVNDIACQRLGYSREELLRMSPDDIDAPEHGSANDPEFLRKLQENWQATIERVHVAKDGRHYPVEIDVHLFTLDGRDAILGVARDISERKLAEAALHDSEARFRQMFESMSSGVVVYAAVGDAEDFVFKDINAAVERIEGVRRQQLIGKSVTEAFPGIREMGLLDVFRRVWQTGKS